MHPTPQILFPPFRLDPLNEQVWRAAELVPLRPKPFAVLRYLVEHPRRLVTRAELFQAVWPKTYVGEGLLRGYVCELREALGDDPQLPRFIETVPRRGYRFIAPLTTTAPLVSSSKFQVPSSQTTPDVSTQHPAPTLVGREVELQQLHKWLDKALGGERQVVFVTGEAGIGKTTAVDVFVAQAGAKGELWIGRGQCIEHFGAGEPYLPVLEALGQLGQGPEGERLLALLERYAPSWLAQLPALLSPAAHEALQRRTLGATKERMLREMAEALEALTAEQPLILVLEDLQWSDYSTLDLVAFLARRRQPARLLVMGTYRPVDVIVRAHPLRAVTQELHLHGHCAELTLGCLSETAIEEYLAVRFFVGTHGRGPLEHLARRIHRRTDGNPLFMVNVVDHLVRQRVIDGTDGEWTLPGNLEDAAVGVPETLRQLIEQQLERVSAMEVVVLEAASVAGADFSAAAVAAAVATTEEAVEEQCAALVRREQFIRARGTVDWPDGTVAARYGFVHALYQEVLYERIAARRRIGLHRRIGEREEAAYGARAREIAAELALHFERGRDYRRAVQYLQQAGERASQRSAYVEAVAHLTRGLELLKTLPDTPERVQQELTLQLALSMALLATRGYAAPEVGKAGTRARELCQQLGETPQLFPVLFRLIEFYLNRGELQTTHELAEQLMRLAQSVQDPYPLSVAHLALGATLSWLGELPSARLHVEQALALYDPQQHPHPTSTTADPQMGGLTPERAPWLSYRWASNTADPRVECLSYLAAWTLWYLGYPDQALKRSHEVLALAEGLSQPLSLAYAWGIAAWCHLLRREGPLARERAEALMILSTEQGFPYWLAFGTIMRGSVLAEQEQVEEGIAQMQQGLAAFRATRAEAMRPFWLALLAEAYGKGGQVEEGLAVLTEALAAVDKNEERQHEAELHRLKGELTLAQSSVQRPASSVKTSPKSKVQSPKSKSLSSQPPTPSTQEAEACFHKAIDIARKQQAKSWELRATISLSRLWQKQGKAKQAHKMLAKIYDWFTEGFDTADLQEAKALLRELA